MAFKLILIAAVIAVVNAGLISNVIQPTVIAKTLIAEPYDPNPQYTFAYDVQDPYTGDSHGQVESRSGDVVRGSYNLLEADGRRRVVDYVADVNGFNAIVSHHGSGVAVNSGSIPVPVTAAPLSLLPVGPTNSPALTPVASSPIPSATIGSGLATVTASPIPFNAPIAVAQPPAPVVGSTPLTPPVLLNGTATPPAVLFTPAAPAAPWYAPRLPLAPFVGGSTLLSAPVNRTADPPAVLFAPAVSGAPWYGSRYSPAPLVAGSTLLPSHIPLSAGVAPQTLISNPVISRAPWYGSGFVPAPLIGGSAFLRPSVYGAPWQNLALPRYANLW